VSGLIAEEALALLNAFTDKDAEEIGFRATVLLSYARDTGNRPLAISCIALLDEVDRFTKPWHAKRAVTCSLEQVIAAAANMVSVAFVK
jgi:hypothetical protein